MLDSVSLDHLRMFIAAADEGSFSAGGRRLRRAQSVISQTLANLEAQLGVKLFDRSSRSPVLTRQGLALLAEARAVVSRMDAFKARAKGLSGGLEPELSVVVDVMFPLESAHPRRRGLAGRVPGDAAHAVCRSTGCRFAAGDGRSLRLRGDGLSAHRPYTPHTRAPAQRGMGLCRVSHRILWRQSRARFQRVSLRNTGNSFSQTVPNCRKERTSAFFRRTSGGSPTLARSTPSYAQV